MLKLRSSYAVKAAGAALSEAAVAERRNDPVPMLATG
jgi:hypothetical protein